MDSQSSKPFGFAPPHSNSTNMPSRSDSFTKWNPAALLNPKKASAAATTNGTAHQTNSNNAVQHHPPAASTAQSNIISRSRNQPAMQFEFMTSGGASASIDSNSQPPQRPNNIHVYVPNGPPPPAHQLHNLTSSAQSDTQQYSGGDYMDTYHRLNQQHGRNGHRLGYAAPGTYGLPMPASESNGIMGQNGYESSGASTNTASMYGDSHHTNGVGMGGMLERMHNVADRSEMPQKRPRPLSSGDDERAKKRRTFQAGSGGELADYVKKKQEEGRAKRIANGDMYGSVDLTDSNAGNRIPGNISNGSIDLTEDVEMNEPVNEDDMEVCFGRIDGAEVITFLAPSAKPGTVIVNRDMWPAIKVLVRRRDEHMKSGNLSIEVIDGTKTVFGCLDSTTSMALCPILDSPWMQVRTVGRILMRPKKPNDPQPGEACSMRLSLDVSLYGPRKHMKQIGNHLHQKGLRLVSPLLMEKGTVLANPHASMPPAQPKGGSRCLGYTTTYTCKTAEEVKSDVMGVFDRLQQADTMEETEASYPITTTLLQHQKQGLTFMIEREKLKSWEKDEDRTNSLWKATRDGIGQVRYYNVVTTATTAEKPEETRGGILADMMGLGKTLSILSLCATTVTTDAKAWARAPVEADNANYTGIINSRATLLVSPLSVIANWEEQISQHIAPGGLKYHVFHGSARCTDIRQLADNDIVITTYGTAAAIRNKNKNPLEQINWFRIVLDEAHIIREQKTAQCQAICRLPAQRRWAVTGTPVQNKLDDLGALLKFLRLKPFDDRAMFSRYILTPCKNADPEILPKLRVLVDSITLRRQKDRIGLPKRIDKKIELTFTADEQRVYDIFAENAQNSVKMLTNTHNAQHMMRGQSYAYILQAILRLRLICAHGKDLLNEKDLELLAGRTANEAIALDDDDDDTPVLTHQVAYRMYNMARQTDDSCLNCAKQLGRESTDSDSEGKEAPIGYMTPCYHLLCKECIKDYNKTMSLKSVDGGKTAACMFCATQIRLGAFPLKLSEADDVLEKSEDKRAGKQVGKDYSGPHTKTQFLINELLSNAEKSALHPDEPPIKSVVFSGWTSHLNLIQHAFENAGITYTRLDGRMSRSARSAALENFRTDPAICVILISISAGGLGLNLTHANKVYVMEPQYNPAAEEQAVDRVYRLGQKREVEVNKLVMKGSFEEKMLVLQEKKRRLARLSMDGERKGKVAREEVVRQRLEELRALFR